MQRLTHSFLPDLLFPKRILSEVFTCLGFWQLDCLKSGYPTVHSRQRQRYLTVPFSFGTHAIQDQGRDLSVPEEIIYGYEAEQVYLYN